MRYFCTYFDSNFLTRGLALYQSLVRHAKPFRLWVLCLDEPTYHALQTLELSEATLIAMEEFEAGDRELLRAKGNRSRIEYYFTCTPSLPLYVLEHCSEVDVITYLDADLYFFSDPAPIYQELGDCSVAIIGHRFLERFKYLEVKGIYNVGLVSFRRDDVGWQCLRWWRDRCLEWCYDRVQGGRYADQKYLDDWPTRFPGVVVLEHQGVGLAPWNVGGCSLHLGDGQVLVDSLPVVFFHFHGLKQRRRWLYDLDLATYGARAGPFLKQHIYRPYLQELAQVTRWMSLSVGPSCTQTGPIRGRMPESAAGGLLLGGLRKVWRHMLMVRRYLRGQSLVVIGERVM
jgi:hypothetical protein